MTAKARQALLNTLMARSFRHGRVTLSSGKESDFYINCKESLTSEGLILVGEAIFWEISRFAPHARAVGGLTMGADPLAVATSIVSRWSMKPGSLTAFYVRKEPKAHGTKKWIEGPTLAPGTPVVIVEDVITTGASALKAIERVREHGLEPVLVVTLVDRMEENGRQNIEAAGVRVESVFDRHDFFKKENQ